MAFFFRQEKKIKKKLEKSDFEIFEIFGFLGCFMDFWIFFFLIFWNFFGFLLSFCQIFQTFFFRFIEFFLKFFGFHLDFFGFQEFLSKLLRLLIKDTKVTAGHQKLPKMGKNSIKSSLFCPKGKKSLVRRPKPSAGARSRPAQRAVSSSACKDKEKKGQHQKGTFL